MPSIHSELANHLSKVVGASGYTVSANGNATVGASMDQRQMEELVRVASVCGYQVKLVAGVPTLTPR